MGEIYYNPKVIYDNNKEIIYKSAGYIPNDDTIFYYRLDNLIDRGPYNAHLTNNNSVTFSSGTGYTYSTFVNSYASTDMWLEHSSPYNLPDIRKYFSMCFWYRRRNNLPHITLAEATFSLGDGVTTYNKISNYQVHVNENLKLTVWNVTTQSGAANTLSSVKPFVAEEWNFCCYAKNGTTSYHYSGSTNSGSFGFLGTLQNNYGPWTTFNNLQVGSANASPSTNVYGYNGDISTLIGEDVYWNIDKVQEMFDLGPYSIE